MRDGGDTAAAEEIARLADMAVHCRFLASYTITGSTHRTLIEMAEEFEAKVARLQGPVSICGGFNCP